MFWFFFPLPFYVRPKNTLAAAGSCKTWFYLFCKNLADGNRKRGERKTCDCWYRSSILFILLCKKKERAFSMLSGGLLGGLQQINTNNGLLCPWSKISSLLFLRYLTFILTVKVAKVYYHLFIYQYQILKWNNSYRVIVVKIIRRVYFDHNYNIIISCAQQWQMIILTCHGSLH